MYFFRIYKALCEQCPRHNIGKYVCTCSKYFFSPSVCCSQGKVVFQQFEVKSCVKNELSVVLVQDLLEYVLAKFKILYEEKTQVVDEKTAETGTGKGESGRLQLFERELSVTQQDIFYRKLNNDESPLELFMLWKINQERKTLLLTDHDPNIRKYGKCSDEGPNHLHNILL